MALSSSRYWRDIEKSDGMPHHDMMPFLISIQKKQYTLQRQVTNGRKLQPSFHLDGAFITPTGQKMINAEKSNVHREMVHFCYNYKDFNTMIHFLGGCQ